MLSAGQQRDWPIAWLTAVQDLESSGSLVRIGLQAGRGVKSHQTGR